MGEFAPLSVLALLLAGLLPLLFTRPPALAVAGVPKTRTGTARHRTSRPLDWILEQQAALAKKISDGMFAAQYRKHLVDQNLAPRTITSTMQVVGQFVSHLADKRKRWYEPSNKLLNSFLDRERRTCTTGRRWVPDGVPVASSTRHKDEGIIMLAYEWAAAQGLLVRSPFAGRKRMREPRSRRRYVPREDVRRLMDTAATEDARMLVVISLAFWAGFRAGGVADSCAEDVDWYAQEIAVRGKGDGGQVTDWIPMAPQLMEVLAPWMARMPARGPLVPSKANPARHLKAPTVSAMASRFMRACGVKETLHGLRHSAAKEWAAVDDNPRAAQHLLVHQSLAVTETVYLGGQRSRLMLDAVLGRPPIEQDFEVLGPRRRVGETHHFPGLGDRAAGGPGVLGTDGHEVARREDRTDPNTT